jgi:hypothetical protein
MHKYDVGDIIKITPIDDPSRAWYALITKIHRDRYYYFFLDNGDRDWSVFNGLDSNERISLHA